MTLLQTWVYPGGVLHVSDRRLTDHSTQKVITDSRNKAVLWCGRRGAFFTGLAYLGRARKKPVSHWIAETLADHTTFDAGIEALRAGATEEIKKLELAEHLRGRGAEVVAPKCGSSPREKVGIVLSTNVGEPCRPNARPRAITSSCRYSEIRASASCAHRPWLAANPSLWECGDHPLRCRCGWPPASWV